jgi:hypothetical protein
VFSNITGKPPNKKRKNSGTPNKNMDAASQACALNKEGERFEKHKSHKYRDHDYTISETEQN